MHDSTKLWQHKGVLFLNAELIDVANGRRVVGRTLGSELRILS